MSLTRQGHMALFADAKDKENLCLLCNNAGSRTCPKNNSANKVYPNFITYMHTSQRCKIVTRCSGYLENDEQESNVDKKIAWDMAERRLVWRKK